MFNLHQPKLSRRGLLGGAAAAGAAGLLTGALPHTALAKAPMSNAQAPYWYRFKLGGLEVTVVSDGTLPLGEPSGSFLGVTKDQVGKMLTDNFLPTDNVVLEQNIPIVNTGDKLVMFDSGMGLSKMFGPTTGRLLKSLGEAGIDPANIDVFVASHAHIDHVGGLVGEGGKKLFPNATIYLSQLDFDFWTDESNQKANKDFVAHARLNLLPYREQIKFYKDGEEFLPGIQAMHAPGHTVGHTVFVLTSQGKSMAYIGDLTHHQILLMERPLTQFAYDTDPAQSAQTRVKYLDMFATQKVPVLAYHFPWPGIGHVAKAGDGFRFFAEPMKML